MKNPTPILLAIGVLTFTNCDTLKQTAGQMATDAINQQMGGGNSTSKPILSKDDAIKGLKEALLVGVNKGTDRLGAVGAFAKNPSYKIPLPPDVQAVEQKIRDNRILNKLIGGELDKVVDAMNTGAENSMKTAVPIFKKTVTEMSFQDAMGILTGGEGAATSYLRKTTESDLQGAFKPEVKKALDGVSLTKIWNPVVTQINKNKRILGLDNDIQIDLNQYVTEKATTALFQEVEKEENNIRKDPVTRTTEILKKAFNYADQQRK